MITESMDYKKSPNEFGMKAAFNNPQLLWQYSKAHEILSQAALNPSGPKPKWS